MSHKKKRRSGPRSSEGSCEGRDGANVRCRQKAKGMRRAVWRIRHWTMAVPTLHVLFSRSERIIDRRRACAASPREISHPSRSSRFNMQTLAMFAVPTCHCLSIGGDGTLAPSEAWLLSFPRTMKNFSASMTVSHALLCSHLRGCSRGLPISRLCELPCRLR